MSNYYFEEEQEIKKETLVKEPISQINLHQITNGTTQDSLGYHLFDDKFDYNLENSFFQNDYYQPPLVDINSACLSQYYPSQQEEPKNAFDGNQVDDFMEDLFNNEDIQNNNINYQQQQNTDVYFNSYQNNEEQQQNNNHEQIEIENQYENLNYLSSQLSDDQNNNLNTTNTANQSNQLKQRRDVKDDRLIQRIQNLTQLDIGIEALRQFKNEIKKNTIRTILQKSNKNINQVRLQQYFENKLQDQQVFQIYNRIDNIYNQLFPDSEKDLRKDILVAFVQLYNENRTKFNYNNVKYLFQDASSNKGEINKLIEIVKEKINRCPNYIQYLINCAQKIFIEFFNYFLDNQLIPYLYSEYKMNTYPNARYPSPQYKQIDIHVTLYCVESLFIENMQ
ncbi:hypothetical protein TTHERM_00463190 (macronuclear) [Tetrahymena thermophila SB210]|uniref:Uncharacterized protein n=1 Tax=Tetrahymena thermophila (strain SB210) TaxID=312017 RepID=Q23PW4_TETTS|nr:hypothetical protein TTHERM_00463190 [Tetrahymena thermophila SB210]EAR98571.1 hypothetical protein TTHERM_00463190 [Tetrahymena thermophila SB210]|eukprot:XP_001018816.1 hypothetical protein TTHERM_00463190 [Tetrahymena thermophila SB210]